MTDTITLRPAVMQDLNFLQKCAHDAYVKYVLKIGKEPAPMVADFAAHIDVRQAYVICVDKDEVGYSIHWKRSTALYIDNIALLPKQQGNGLGRQVFSMLEGIAAENGCVCMELYTNALMEGPPAFYPSIGFEIVDRRIEDGFDRVYFRKRI